MTRRAVVVRDTNQHVADTVAERFVPLLRGILEGKPVVHVALTGGSVGIAILRSVAGNPDASDLDWTRVHFWWGDERWLPAGDTERNDRQATDALLRPLGIPAENVHAFPSSDEGIDLDTAAERYRDELAAHAAGDGVAPTFDVTFLGVGPDGHVASLFPHFDEVNAEAPVVAVRNSPKPPSERLSLSLPVINASERVWLGLAGADKASALGLALAGASRNLVPVAGVSARLETVFFVDVAAAADVPQELIDAE